MATMSKNWFRICGTLLSKSESKELTLCDERQALLMIEKNIYHKKPTMFLITFTIVSLGVIIKRVPQT